MNTVLKTPDQLDAFTAGNPAALVYFSGPGCNVCRALKPKLMAMMTERFPEVALADVDCGASPELATQLGVFAIPTVVIWFDGRESLRKGRGFGLGELADDLARPYGMLFG